MSWRGILSGALALIALEAVLNTTNSANRVGSGIQWLADLVSAAIDPSVPAIPDLAGGGGGGGGEFGFEGTTPEVVPGPEAFGGGSGGGGGGAGSW